MNKIYDSDGEPGPFCDMEDPEDTQYFYKYARPDVFLPGAGKIFSDYGGNEYVAEGGEKSNNDSSHTVHVDIPLYKFQRMNINQLKDKLMKRKTSVC